jgi:hypothetical protein
MYIRPTLESDLDALMPIFDFARGIMRATGNHQQWTGGYPSRELLLHDIEMQQSYVCVADTGELLATFCFFVGNDPTYFYIENGSWLNDLPYGVVHRLATNGKQKGMGVYCMNWCLEQCPNLRVDTHADNVVMQTILLNMGFRACGIIYLSNGDERLAFQKTI